MHLPLRRSRFNGARFFWNREASPSHKSFTPRSGSFNGARFFWNREGMSAKRLSGPPARRLQWGPVLLEPGSPRSRLRLRRGTRPASMGPGSFGTGKERTVGGRREREHMTLQWGPVLLEPGRFSRHSLRWRSDSASMGPGSFGTGKTPPDQKGAHAFGWLQWGPVLLEPGRCVPTTSDLAKLVQASMGPGSFGTGKGATGPPAPRPVRRFNGARFFWNREEVVCPINHIIPRALLQWGPVLLEPGRSAPEKGRKA